MISVKVLETMEEDMEKETKIRCIKGKYGVYMLIDDLQKSLYKDAYSALKRQDTKVAQFAEGLAERLEDLKT